MADRFVLYEALSALNCGYYMVRGSDLSLSYYLEGCVDICHIGDELIQNGWVSPVNKQATHYTITDKGRAVLRDGRERYRAFPFWKRLLGQTRFFDFTW